MVGPPPPPPLPPPPLLRAPVQRVAPPPPPPVPRAPIQFSGQAGAKARAPVPGPRPPPPSARAPPSRNPIPSAKPPRVPSSYPKSGYDYGDQSLLSPPNGPAFPSGKNNLQMKGYSYSDLPPPPEVAPKFPSIPPLSVHMDAGLEPRFPSFTMDFYGNGENDELVGNGNYHDENLEPDLRHGRDVADSMPRPWDKPLDASLLGSPTSKDSRKTRALNGGKGKGGKAREEEDEIDDAFDIPSRLTIGPGAAAARLDLQRCTMKVHKQLVNQLQSNSMKPGAYKGSNHLLGKGDDPHEDSLSRAQGELYLKSRIPLRGWRRLYGSIVDHSYFGPVLFLFKYDAKGNVTLHHNMMIVLADSYVRLGQNTTTREGGYRCEFELKTTSRKYLLAANHTMRRDYWIWNIEEVLHASQHAAELQTVPISRR